MSIDEFRKNPLLMAELAELLKNPILQQALEVCNQASPSNGGIKVWEQPHMAHIQLGIDRGYNLYPLLLKTLALPAKPEESPIEPTYEVVTEEEK